jgi:hypothetical protein
VHTRTTRPRDPDPAPTAIHECPPDDRRQHRHDLGQDEDADADRGIFTPKRVGVDVTPAALHALYGAGDPLELLRAIESEFATLGALAEASRPGEVAEFLNVSAALGPTLSIAARQIGVAIDLLDERLELPPSPHQPEPSDPLPDESESEDP